MKYLKSYRLFEKVEGLDVSGEDLTELPELSKTLQDLCCRNNLLTSLPELPNTLTSLDCYGNELTSLPKLPNKLEYLNFADNKITHLPELPESLEYITWWGNDWKEPLKYEDMNRFDEQQSTGGYNDEQFVLFNSEEFQRKFLTENPERFRDLTILDLEIHPTIRKEFNYIFEGEGMGFFELKTKESK